MSSPTRRRTRRTSGWGAPHPWAYRAWLLANIEHRADPLLQLQDEWEYRRLGELYAQLDDDLLGRLVTRGRASLDTDMRQAAHDFDDWLARSHQNDNTDASRF